MLTGHADRVDVAVVMVVTVAMAVGARRRVSRSRHAT
jgi:hypothetical protein